MLLVHEEIRPRSRRVCVCPGPGVDQQHSLAWFPLPFSPNDHFYAWTSFSCHLCTCSILSHPYLKFIQFNVLTICTCSSYWQLRKITGIFWLQFKENWVIPLIKSWKRIKFLSTTYLKIIQKKVHFCRC